MREGYAGMDACVRAVQYAASRSVVCRACPRDAPPVSISVRWQESVSLRLPTLHDSQGIAARGATLHTLPLRVSSSFVFASSRLACSRRGNAQ